MSLEKAAGDAASLGGDALGVVGGVLGDAFKGTIHGAVGVGKSLADDVVNGTKNNVFGGMDNPLSPIWALATASLKAVGNIVGEGVKIAANAGGSLISAAPNLIMKGLGAAVEVAKTPFEAKPAIGASPVPAAPAALPIKTGMIPRKDITEALAPLNGLNLNMANATAPNPGASLPALSAPNQIT